MRPKISLTVAIGLCLVMAVYPIPGPSSADEFKHDGSPVFTVAYPSGSKSTSNVSPTNVWSVKTLGGGSVRATVAPIPEGLELKDVAEKWYLPRLAKTVKTDVRMEDNKEITLSDGNKGFYSEMSWNFRSGAMGGGEYLPYKAFLVSIFKDMKLVILAGWNWDNYGELVNIVRSLRFQ